MQLDRTGALTGVGPRSEKLSLLRNLAWRASAPGSWKPRREPLPGLSAPGDSSCSPRVADRRSGLAPDAAISSLLCRAGGGWGGVRSVWDTDGAIFPMLCSTEALDLDINQCWYSHDAASSTLL